MTDEQPGSDNAAAGRSARQPGRELRAARERSGIERETIASRLRLRVSQFDALERDHYEELPPPTFVRGYIRTYAREVGLDADDLVAAYDATGAGDDEPDIQPATGSERPHTGRGTLVGLILIVLAVGGGGAAWFYQHRQQAAPSATAETSADTRARERTESRSATEPDGTESAADPAAGDQADASTSGAEESEAQSATQMPTTAGASGDEETVTGTEAATPEPASTADTGPDSDDATASGDGAADNGARASGAASEPGEADSAVAQAEDAETAADPQDGDDAAAGTSAEGASDGQQEASTPQATDVAADATTAAAAEGPDRLILQFEARSWVQVSDDRDRRLVYTLYYGSDPLEVRGWAPFDVLLGNSPGVTIRFNGESVAKSGFTRDDDTARFLVDASGARAR